MLHSKMHAFVDVIPDGREFFSKCDENTFNVFIVCNFIVHEKCVTNVVTPCSGVAPCQIKNPVAHCWSEPLHHKRRFCNVCRKRLDEIAAVHCLSKCLNLSVKITVD